MQLMTRMKTVMKMERMEEIKKVKERVERVGRLRIQACWWRALLSQVKPRLQLSKMGKHLLMRRQTN